MKLSCRNRALIAAKLRTEIEICFAHWEALPGFDLDVSFETYLDDALAAEDRFAFDMASLRFLASLQNGHTSFDDRWLWQEHGASFGIFARPVQGQRAVISSQLTDVPVGTTIRTLNGQPMEAFFERVRPLIAASSRRGAAHLLFGRRYLFPERFEVELGEGRTKTLTKLLPLLRTAAAPELKWLQPGQVALLRLPDFGSPEYEQTAVQKVAELPPKATLIIDVRGNGGGSTPETLIAALMDRPYRGWIRSTVAHNAVDRAGGQPRAMVVMPAETSEPEPSAFQGKLMILVDGACWSAAEDFIAPFKDNGRALLVGEATGGSSGQPHYVDLGDGMSARVSAKRQCFPDGSTFEGIGVQPDLVIDYTVDDLRAGRDRMLEAALSFA